MIPSLRGTPARDLGKADLEVEPATMFVVAAAYRREVLALSMVNAWWDTRSRSLASRPRPYLHSHMTGVHIEYARQGRWAAC